MNYDELDAADDTAIQLQLALTDLEKLQKERDAFHHMVVDLLKEFVSFQLPYDSPVCARAKAMIAGTTPPKKIRRKKLAKQSQKKGKPHGQKRARPLHHGKLRRRSIQTKGKRRA